MHPVANSVEIPLEELERLLVSRAVPDFTGTVTVHVKVLPTAAHEVQFTAETQQTYQVDRSRETTVPVVTNARVNKVRSIIREHSHRFVLATPIVQVKASFVAGDLRSFQIGEVEQCQSQATQASR